MFRHLLALLLAAGTLALSPTALAIDFVGATSAAGDTDTLTVAKPAGVEAGDLMVAQMSFRGGAIGFTPPPDWIELAPRSNSGDEINQVTFYRFATSPDPADYTWTIDSPEHFAVAISAYRGVDLTDPIDATGVQTGSTTNPVAPSITTSSADTRLIGLWSRAHQQTLTPPAGMESRAAPTDGAGAGGIRALLADEPFAGPGATGSRTAASGGGGSRHYVGRLLALRAATGDVPARLRFDQQPTDTTLGQVISPPVTVRIEDADGALVTGADNAVTIAIEDNPGGGTLGGTTTVNAVDGIATFDNLTVDAIGSGYTLRATSPDLDPDVSDPFAILEPVQEANAFEPDTPAGTTFDGIIRTKIAGAPFDLDIVMIDDGEVDEDFDRPVDVWLLDASDDSGALDSVGCRDSWTPIQNAGSIGFGDVAGGRATLSGIQENEAWRRVRVMIEQTFPPGQAGVRGCSVDAFAIRPDAFVDVRVTHEDWETPGTADTLDQTDPAGGTVHKAGRPFSIEATAVNALGGVTERYDGSQELTLSVECIDPGGGCFTGTISADDWNANDGIVQTDSAEYDEVGAFELVLEDREFSSIDATDSTEAERFIVSDAVDVGRFVPDHFTLHPGALGNRAGDPECGGDFTYIGEPFRVSFILRARPFTDDPDNDAVTRNYQGTFARLDPADGLGSMAFAALDEDSETDLTDRLEPVEPDIGWSEGEGTATALVTVGRETPENPLLEVIAGVDLTDDDGITIPSETYNLDPGDTGTDTHAAVTDDTTELRFGRLLLDNAAGSELAALDLPLHVQYWHDDVWRTNEDDGCTAIAIDATDELRLIADSGDESDGTETVSLAGGGETGIDPDQLADGEVVLDEGRGVFTLTAPGAGNIGWVEIVLDLDVRYPYLRDDLDEDGEWEDSPSARATFGIFRGPDNRIQIREVSP